MIALRSGRRWSFSEGRGEVGIGGFLDPGLPPARFARNVALASLGAVAAALLAYVALSPGMAETLAENGWPAARLLLRQTLLNGWPVVFVSTWAGAVLLGKWGRHRRSAWAVALADTGLRLAVFVAMHTVTYVVAAQTVGSFGGDRITALGVVAPTLAGAASFGNLSGAWLYATLGLAMPMQVRSSMSSARPALTSAAAWSIAASIALGSVTALSMAMAAIGA